MVDRALKLRPDFVLALINKAFTLSEVGRFDEAVTASSAMSGGLILTTPRWTGTWPSFSC